MKFIKKVKMMEEKKLLEKIGFVYLSAYDKSIISFVEKEIRSINTGAVIIQNPVSFGIVYGRSLDYLSIISEELVTKTAILLSGLEFYQKKHEKHLFSCDLGLKENGVFIRKYGIPDFMDDTSVVFLSSEHIHALKDTNIDEYKYSGELGDVLSYLFEMILVDKYSIFQKDVYNARIMELKKSFIDYKNYINQIKKFKDYKDLYKILMCLAGQSLNSYYYALLLYKMYKENPSMILDYVNKILNHNISTMDMLVELGLYEQDLKEDFKEEIDEIKKF